MARPWLLAGLGFLLAALMVGAAVAHGQVLLTWDLPIQRLVEAHRTATLTTVFATISRFGSTMVVLTAGPLLALIAWRRCTALGLTIAIATASRPVIEFLLKDGVGRARPDLHRLVPGTGPSFPSGHVMAAVALWALVPAVVALYSSRRAVWAASVVVCGLLVAGITASRVYLGVHWFSDVTGGLVVGAFFLVGVDTVFQRAHVGRPCTAACSPDAPTGVEARPEAVVVAAAPAEVA